MPTTYDVSMFPTPRLEELNNLYTIARTNPEDLRLPVSNTTNIIPGMSGLPAKRMSEADILKEARNEYMKYYNANGLDASFAKSAADNDLNNWRTGADAYIQQQAQAHQAQQADLYQKLTGNPYNTNNVKKEFVPTSGVVTGPNNTNTNSTGSEMMAEAVNSSSVKSKYNQNYMYDFTKLKNANSKDIADNISNTTNITDANRNMIENVNTYIDSLMANVPSGISGEDLDFANKNRQDDDVVLDRVMSKYYGDLEKEKKTSTRNKLRDIFNEMRDASGASFSDIALAYQVLRKENNKGEGDLAFLGSNADNFATTLESINMAKKNRLKYHDLTSYIENYQNAYNNLAASQNNLKGIMRHRANVENTPSATRYLKEAVNNNFENSAADFNVKAQDYMIAAEALNSLFNK